MSPVERFTRLCLSRIASTLMRARLVGWLALLMLGSLAAPQALAQDHITERAWLEDPTGSWSLAQAQSQPAKPYRGTLSRGFGHSALWLRLRIDPKAHPAPAKDADRLVLQIRPLYLDDIRVFDPLAPAGVAGVLGDRHPPGDAELQGLDFLLPLARGTEPRDIWIRVTSTSTRQVTVQALNPDDLARETRRQQLVFAVYIGLILLLTVWGLTYWLFSRERVIGAFGVLQASALLFAVGSLGYTRALWPAHWPAAWLDTTTSVGSILAVSTAVFFHIVHISEFRPPSWAKLIQFAMLALLPVKLFMLPWLPMEALRLNMLEVLAGPVVFLVSVLFSTGWAHPSERRRPALARSVVVGFYVLLLAVLAGAALPGMGLSSGGEIPLYLVQAHGLITAFLILLMLQYRAHVLNQQQRETALALERSELQARQEREVRQERDKLLAMLAHELKTPLATIHMRLDTASTGSREIRQAIRDMDGVIERCLQSARLADGHLVAHTEAFDAAGLVRDAASACSQPARVRLDLPPVAVMRSDRQLLSIVLNNLLENACKYAEPDTPVQVTLRRHAAADRDTAGEWQLVVANLPGAAGWPDPDQVFQKYYRSAHARRQAGTGLGLFLVRSVVQALGGSITYAPDATHVRFVIDMPTQPPVAQEAEDEARDL